MLEIATKADARQLPFPDASFAAAYLVTVLGEIPEPAVAARELCRVLKPTERLIVGEFSGWTSGDGPRRR